MKITLNEEILTEGKNLQQTLDRYRDKFKKAYDPFETSDEEADKLMMSVISNDPTYQEGGTTTGDYGIWLLNQELKDNIQKFEATKDISITDLLNEFIEKKANLANKDLNSYKSPDELYKILSDVQLTDRQKERKLRKDISGAKHVGSTANFDIYIPETYEASCALGKGSGWCTADSRTRQYFDYYKDRYGGDYYIVISKDGKYKYQIHFESQQYSAAGTNPDINNPNEEEMLEYEDIILKWPELQEFFNEKKLNSDPQFIVDSILNELGVSEYCNYLIPAEWLIRMDDSLKWWFIEDPSKIPSIRVQKAIFDNKNVAQEWMGIINKRDKNHVLSIEELQECSYNAFKAQFKKRLKELKYKINQSEKFTYLQFYSLDDRYMNFQVSRRLLAKSLVESDGGLGWAIQEYINQKDLDELKKLLASFDFDVPDDLDTGKVIQKLFFTEIKSDVEEIPYLFTYYFNDSRCVFFFTEYFEDDVMDMVDNKQFEQKYTED